MKITCVQLKFPSLDRGTSDTCPVSLQTSSTFLPDCLLFHTENPTSTKLFVEEKLCCTFWNYQIENIEDIFQIYFLVVHPWSNMLQIIHKKTLKFIFLSSSFILVSLFSVSDLL